MGRRKYRFPDRSTAEAKLADVEIERTNQVRLARALFTRSIRWVYRGGSYRFGVFDLDSACGMRVVVVFHPKTGQEPDLKVYDEFSESLRDMEREALHYPNEFDSQHILDGVRAARCARWDSGVLAMRENWMRRSQRRS